MISVADAKLKPKQIDPNVSQETVDKLNAVLDRQIVLTPEMVYVEKWGKPLFEFIEKRLAQPHIHELAPDQVNGVWGGSTTTAIVHCASRYSVGVDPKHPQIGSDTLRAILDGSKPNEPPMPKGKDTYEWLRYQLQQKNYVFNEKEMAMNVIGIRGYLLGEGQTPNAGDLYNDTYFLVYTKNGVNHCDGYMASADAGYYYYHEEDVSDDQRGCAHLLPGQYDYQLGIHINYPAVVQAGPVWIARSMSANYDLKTCRKESGYFGINNHSGYDYLPLSQWKANLGSVWNSSAGCQVIRSAGPDGWHWQTYYGTVAQTSIPVFKLTLLDSLDLKN